MKLMALFTIIMHCKHCFRADGLMVNHESMQHRLLAKQCFALTVSSKKLITMQKHKQSVSHAHNRKASANIALPNKLDLYTENITHCNTQNYTACQALQHNQPQVWSLKQQLSVYSNTVNKMNFVTVSVEIAHFHTVMALNEVQQTQHPDTQCHALLLCINKLY